MYHLCISAQLVSLFLLFCFSPKAAPRFIRCIVGLLSLFCGLIVQHSRSHGREGALDYNSDHRVLHG